MTTGPQIIQQLQQELQNELTTATQLLRLISLELQQFKELTEPGGKFEANIKKNASLMSALANMQQLNIGNLPALTRLCMTTSNDVDQNISHEQHESVQDKSNMDESS